MPYEACCFFSPTFFSRLSYISLFCDVMIDRNPSQIRPKGISPAGRFLVDLFDLTRWEKEYPPNHDSTKILLKFLFPPMEYWLGSLSRVLFVYIGSF